VPELSQRMTEKFDLAGLVGDQTQQGAKQRGLARAVAAEQGHHFPLADIQVDTEEDLLVAQPGVDAGCAYHEVGHWQPFALRSESRLEFMTSI
jgi:hypothetical protein